MDTRIECINFDLDSVLYISSDFIEASLFMSLKAMIQMGLKADLEAGLAKLREIRSRNSNAKDHFDRLCLHFNKTYDPLVIAAGVEKYWDCKIGFMTSAPEAHRVLSAFHKKYPLTIVSNGPPVKQAGKIVRLGLSHFFAQYDGNAGIRGHFFFSASEENRRKPYPHLWLEAQKAVGFHFSRSVMVGDRYWHDIFGANRLGMITIKINQGPHADETIQEAFEKKWETEESRSFFSKYHTDEEVFRLLHPDYTIRGLKELEHTVEVIEGTLQSPSD